MHGGNRSQIKDPNLESTRMGGLVTSKLGTEWDVSTLVACLAELSAHSWLWMDQIAKQPGTEQAEVIGTFATVYSRCAVVVLLPGAASPVLRMQNTKCLTSGVMGFDEAFSILVSIVMHYVIECASFEPKRRWF